MTTKFEDDLTEDQAQRITAALKEDVRWLIEQGQAGKPLQFNPRFGAVFDHNTATWRQPSHECGTCLVGAHLVRTQPGYIEPDHEDCPDDECYIFARQHGITIEAAEAIFHTATGMDIYAACFPRAARVAVECVRYAATLGWQMPNELRDDLKDIEKHIKEALEDAT